VLQNLATILLDGSFRKNTGWEDKVAQGGAYIENNLIAHSAIRVFLKPSSQNFLSLKEE
jgi:hypothetical protein